MKQVAIMAIIMYIIIKLFVSNLIGKLPIEVDMNALPDTEQLQSYPDLSESTEELPPPIPPRLT